MKTVALMQSMYHPFVGYLQMMNAVDAFYYYTDVQFVRQSWHHRNRIRTKQGWMWLDVPVLHSAPHGELLIKNASIDISKRWRKQHWNSIQAWYRRSPYWDLYAADLERIYNAEWYSLMHMNIEILDTFYKKHLEIETPTFNEAKIAYDRDVGKMERLLNFCRAVDADLFLEPGGGTSFFDEEAFKEAGIELRFFHYDPIEYEQLWPGFHPWMCALDTLFCLGPEAKDVLKDIEWYDHEVSEEYNVDVEKRPDPLEQDPEMR